MATINYVTLKFPEILLRHLEPIQNTPNFKVCRYTNAPGIIFRIPFGVMPGDICHFFIEHEVNLTNTIKTGTLTLKVQITILPVVIGLFSGFDDLKGSYQTDHYDEQDQWGYERFVPDYDRSKKIVVPLPVGGKTNLYEYLNEILFKQSDNLDIIHEYAVNLGCQKEKLKENVVFAPVPVNKSKTMPAASVEKHRETQLMFDFLSNQNYQLMP